MRLRCWFSSSPRSSWTEIEELGVLLRREGWSADCVGPKAELIVGFVGKLHVAKETYGWVLHWRGQARTPLAGPQERSEGSWVGEAAALSSSLSRSLQRASDSSVACVCSVRPGLVARPALPTPPHSCTCRGDEQLLGGLALAIALVGRDFLKT